MRTPGAVAISISEILMGCGGQEEVKLRKAAIEEQLELWHTFLGYDRHRQRAGSETSGLVEIQ